MTRKPLIGALQLPVFCASNDTQVCDDRQAQSKSLKMKPRTSSSGREWTCNAAQAEAAVLTGDQGAAEASLAALMRLAPTHQSNHRMTAAIAHALLRLQRWEPGSTDLEPCPNAVPELSSQVLCKFDSEHSLMPLGALSPCLPTVEQC